MVCCKEGGIGLALGDEWLLGGLLLATGDGTARLLDIKDKFDPEYPASHQEQKHEFIHYTYYSTFHITGQSQQNS